MSTGSLLTHWSFAVVFVLGCHAPQAPGGPQAISGSLSVLSYNVHGLPSLITGDDTAGRVAALAPLLNDYDFVGLQEDFIDANHQVIVDASSHPTQRRFAEPLNASRVYGSGLAVLARAEELAFRHHHYAGCSGVLDSASDCLASKGVQAVRVALRGGAEFDLVNTHLEAGGGEDDDRIRQEQVDEVLALLSGWSAGRAVLFVGDFNLHPDDPAELAVLEGLIGGAGLTDACWEVGCSEPDHIDRVLLRDGGALRWVSMEWSREEHFVDDQGQDLSDHPAISARLDWEFAP